MTESISTRLSRIARARVEGLIDRLEQASSPAVMAEAVREVERLIDEVARECDTCVVRRLSAARSQALLRERLADLEAKARFALAEGREDLAEIALGRQMDFEASIAELDGTIAAAAEEEERFAATLAELKQRRDGMAELLKAHEAARAEVGDAGVAGPRQRAAAADRAERAFVRAMGGAVPTATAVAGAETRKGLSEIEQMSRRKTVAERLEKLRANA